MTKTVPMPNHYCQLWSYVSINQTQNTAVVSRTSHNIVSSC